MFGAIVGFAIAFTIITVIFLALWEATYGKTGRWKEFIALEMVWGGLLFALILGPEIWK